MIAHIKSTIPGIGLSSDFISGFCGETEEDHNDTLSLLQEVGFDQAFMFAYSRREKTHAHRNYVYVLYLSLSIADWHCKVPIKLTELGMTSLRR